LNTEYAFSPTAENKAGGWPRQAASRKKSKIAKLPPQSVTSPHARVPKSTKNEVGYAVSLPTAPDQTEGGTDAKKRSFSDVSQEPARR
jgi:hypothetical protein